MKLRPQGARIWRWFILSGWVMVCLLATGLTDVIVMSGESDSGPFQPLSKDEHELRNQLEHQVSHLALQIGECNIGDYAALDATVAYAPLRNIVKAPIPGNPSIAADCRNGSGH